MLRFKVCIYAYLMWISNAGIAQEAGTVTHLSGPLFATTETGVKKILAPHSEVNSGDTLVTADQTYARIKFTDDGEVTLRPNTQFKIESFNYQKQKPEEGNAFFNLVKGGLRTISGVIGKMSANRNRYRMTAASATIGIRGTIYGLNLCQNGSCGAEIADGLHIDVTAGSVMVANQAGSQQINTGQFGYVQSQNAPPIIVPANPGIKFTPPPTFTQKSGPNYTSNKPNTVMSSGGCEVH